MAFLPILRLIVLIATTVFAVIVLGISAHLTSLSEEFLGGYFVFAAMAIAAAALTMITLPAMIGIDFIRRGAFTSMVLVELVWVFVLWVLWISAAGLTAQEQQSVFGEGNSCNYVNTDLATACHEFSAIEAFSFLAWIVLMGYNITLLVYAIIGANRGNKTWTSSVADGLLTPRGDTVPVTPMSTGGGAAPSMQYPPQQQQPQWTGQSNHTPMTAQV
ncbi:hypothetical protein J3R30DRAFT_1028009 [Lentinula aciculospora]|uniref:MARVEL domain-containing protein n=1 Tax=Lentinula aciculospora TaxID=153920 RepID=A0A9W9A1B7_9AGAR|nr:hypothetical protein J3R30DRAFT_1028009 [Lentinula aciculospora]